MRFASLACICLLFIGCTRDEGAVPPPTPGVSENAIKIGSWGPLTGPAASWGTVLKSMDTYFKYINDSGGIHGRKIDFVYGDDQYDPAKTPAIVRKLVEEDGVFAIVGGIGTANGRAVADYLEKKNVPFFTPASGDKYWTEPAKKNVYTVYPRYATEGQILGEYIGRELRSLKVVALYQDDEFGTQGADGLQRGIEKYRGKLLAKVSCRPTDTDLSKQVQAIMAAKPEVVAIFTAPKQAVAAVKLLHAEKNKPHILTSLVLNDPIMFALAGKEVWQNTITSSSTKLATSDDESVKKYREVLAKYGGGKLPVGAFSQAGFVIGAAFVEGLQRAGKTLTREGLYRALASMQGFDGGGPYWTAKGMGPPITFSETDHLGNDEIFFAKAVDGKWERVSDWIALASARK
ncbi:ABC transporter substrate-binding protein [Myxococcota bacterium]